MARHNLSLVRQCGVSRFGGYGGGCAGFAWQDFIRKATGGDNLWKIEQAAALGTSETVIISFRLTYSCH